jgi:sialate O-acetylesterase
MRVFLILISLFCLGLQAEVTMPPVFGDHMVLQQGVTLPVWGFASPGEKISLGFAGRYLETVADASGRWRLTMRPLPASLTPEVMVINGSNRIEIRDVIVGDVWICAGEGNMEMPLAQSDTRLAASLPEDSALRCYVAEGESGHRGRGHWEICSRGNTSLFSAVGYFFARDIRATRRIPIGMIQCTRRAAPITSWISRGALTNPPVPMAFLGGGKHSGEERKRASASSSLFQSMIAPLIPYAITGVLWYQGESDEGEAALPYRILLPRLIRDWRKLWGQGPFPFFSVSLAGFGEEGGGAVEPFYGVRGKSRRGWPWIREGTAASLALPFTGVAEAVDLGNSVDPYPLDKLDVGRRLALLARHRVYGEPVCDTGPRYRSFKVEGKKVRVEFDHTGTGLTLAASPVSSDNGTALPPTILKGFALAGNDRKWFPATGRIEGKAVILESDSVKWPVAVRYGWKGNPEGNLYNREGLPASPFRSDSDQPR